MTATPDFTTRLGHGVRVVDTGFHRPRFDAAYLIVESGRAAFIDTGPNPGMPRLLAALDAEGLSRDAVDYVIPTHVHLDHAGGAGALMRELPDARLVVHPRGARHLIDPQHLVRGATAIYGEDEMARAYGTLVPVDADRVTTTTDGLTIELAGRPLTFLDTPGHAMHHHCIWDPASGGCFTGDTFGVSYRDFDSDRGAWITPTTTPVQFQPDALLRSIDRIAALAPSTVYLTHYGPVGDVPRLAKHLESHVRAIVALSNAIVMTGPAAQAAIEQGLRTMWTDSLRAHGVTLPQDRIDELLAIDLALNAQGIGIWRDRLRAAA